MSAVLTIVGLLVTVGGIYCGVAAYIGTLAEHDDGPVSPWATRTWGKLRYVIVHRLLRRKGLPVRVQVGAASTTSSAGRVRMVQSGLPIPADVPLEEQIRLLVQRVRQVEKEADADRKEYGRHYRDLQTEIGALGKRLDSADSDLRALTRSVAVSTARLQIRGLVLVGLGTAIMALPTALNL